MEVAVGAFIDLTGMTFGRWTVLRYMGRGSGKWEVKCECGTISSSTGQNLKSGISKSCGCLRKENVSKSITKHGQSESRTYKIWVAMKKRCNNQKNNDYYRYGGRGIKVCERWEESYQNFLDDMGVSEDGMTLDRIDNDGNYSPDNCRWASRKKQAENKPGVRWIEFEGSRMTISDFAKKTGKNATTVRRNLIHQGRTPEEIALRPNGRGRGMKAKLALSAAGGNS